LTLAIAGNIRWSLRQYS